MHVSLQPGRATQASGACTVPAPGSQTVPADVDVLPPTTTITTTANGAMMGDDRSAPRPPNEKRGYLSDDKYWNMVGERGFIGEWEDGIGSVKRYRSDRP